MFSVPHVFECPPILVDGGEITRLWTIEIHVRQKLSQLMLPELDTMFVIYGIQI
jgi:hypothetical protein